MSAERESWLISTPPGGWQYPWPIAAEMAGVLPVSSWTLVGGLMVQLHAAHAGIPLVRPTIDADVLLHIETGATTFAQARYELERIGFELVLAPGGTTVHRFARGRDQIDVMVADHVAPRIRPPRIQGRPVFAVPGGTAALRRTVDCTLTIAGMAHTISVPTPLAALVLKGAAFRSDRNRGERHLDDAALLAAAIVDPVRAARSLRGHDRGRIQLLEHEMNAPDHRAWLTLPTQWRQRARDVLAVLARNPDGSADSVDPLGW